MTISSQTTRLQGTLPREGLMGQVCQLLSRLQSDRHNVRRLEMMALTSNPELFYLCLEVDASDATLLATLPKSFIPTPSAP